MAIRDIITKALQKTFDELPAEVNLMPLKLWDESVFRYFLARNILDQDRSLHIEREWRKVDLAIASGAEITLVEIKFWQLANLAESTSHALTYPKKGGPGAQNRREYEAVIDKLKNHLAEQALGCIVNAFVVLVYADPIAATSKATFGRYYDDVEASWKVSVAADGRALTCKLIDIHLP